MRAINVRISTQPVVKWEAGKRILVRTEHGIMIGSVQATPRQKSLNIKFDGGEYVSMSSSSKSILGEGINRKRKTAIPDDELVSWKRELCADVILN